METKDIDKWQIDKLRSHPDITDIEITERRAVVTTKCIYIEYNNKKYKIGRFKIIYNPVDSKMSIAYGIAYRYSFINLDAKLVAGYNYYAYHTSTDFVSQEYNGSNRLAKNIFENGTWMCLGNIKNILDNPGCKFITAINLLIEFLKSHEDPTAHTPISYFDEVK